MTEPNFCVFGHAEPGVVRCTRAGCTNWARADDPTQVIAWCQSAGPPTYESARSARVRDTLACVHLVEITGEVHAPSCSCPGNLTAVWECELHGPCTPLATVEGYHDCRTCDQWQEESAE